MKMALMALLLAPWLVFAAGVDVSLDKAPDRSGDIRALQNGARLFVTYCLNCHSASLMRYNRLRDIGFDESTIRGTLLHAADKVGEPMTVAMRSADARLWFGVAPPDLTLVARARASESGSGSDWLYTYLRGFYRDDARPTGWNNAVFANVGMPHVLWELQGEQHLGADHKLIMVKQGKLKPHEYDSLVADLVGFIAFMGEPVANFRRQLGIAVLAFLAILLVFSYALKREYWKDIH